MFQIIALFNISRKYHNLRWTQNAQFKEAKLQGYCDIDPFEPVG